MNPVRKIRSRLGLALHRARWKRTALVYRHRPTARSFVLFGDPSAAPWCIRHLLGYTSDDHCDMQAARYFPMTATQARRLAEDFGFVVFPQWAIPARLDHELLSVDCFVDITIPLPAAEADVVSSLPNSARADLRKIRNRGLRMETSRDPAWAHEFFHRFHYPTVHGRHGTDGFSSPPEELMQLLTEPGAEWIRVYQDDLCISATIASIAREGYMLHRLGWLDGSAEWLTAGAVAALYWFSIQRALELKCPRLHLGGVPPFLNNSQFVYKSKWGGRIVPAFHRFTNRHLLIEPRHPGFRQFFEAQTLVARDRAGNFMVLSSRPPDEVPTASVQTPFIANWFCLRMTAAQAPNPANAILPTPLQPWFDAIPLPMGGQTA